MTKEGTATVSSVMQAVRIGLLIFTVAFWITGFCLFVIGIWSVVELNKYEDLPSHNKYNGVAVVLIIIGLIIACVGICGCCGAYRKNICLLKTFATFLGIVILCEICVAIAGYAYRSKIKSALSKGLNETMQEYKEGGIIRDSWNAMQKNFKCCGNSGYRDWFNTMWHEDNTTAVPKSCCKDPDLSDCNSIKHFRNESDSDKWIYTEGCYTDITNFFREKFYVLASGALGIALIQIIGVGCAGCFWTHIQRKTNYQLV